MEIVQENPTDISDSIQQKIMNVGIYRQAKDLTEQLHPVASALDSAQCDSTNLADAYSIFYSLLQEPAFQAHTHTVQKRFDKAILPCRMAAYMLHPKYKDQGMPAEHSEAARALIADQDA